MCPHCLPDAVSFSISCEIINYEMDVVKTLCTPINPMIK